MNSLRPQRLLAFTLMEVLMVVAIMGILVAMLLPAMKLVREVSNETVCRGGLRQIFLGTLGYRDDNNGVVVPTGMDPLDGPVRFVAGENHPFFWDSAGWPSANNGGVFYGVWWHWSIFDYVANEDGLWLKLYNAWRDSGYAGTFSERAVTWSCPSWKRLSYRNSAGQNNLGWPGFGRNYQLAVTLAAPSTSVNPASNLWNYDPYYQAMWKKDSIYNVFFNNPGAGASQSQINSYRNQRDRQGYYVFKWARIEKPASRILMGDADNAVLQFDVRTDLNELSAGNSTSSSRPSRHRGRANNYLFCDGRATRLVIDRSKTANNLRLGLIGRGE